MVTGNDLAQIRQSRAKVVAQKDILRDFGLTKDQVSVLEQRLEKFTREDARAIANILADPRLKDPEVQINIAKGLGNPKLNQKMASAIPTALAEILQKHPESLGLLKSAKTLGPGADTMISNLKNRAKGKADGIAFELLGTRRLLHKPAGDLRINPMDKISFGRKSQARYKPSGFKERDVLGGLIRIDPDRWENVQGDLEKLGRRTVESDLHIYHPEEPFLPTEILVDFKHTQNKSVKRHIDEGELLGKATAIATGEINEAHFVCNGQLQNTTKQRVADINELLSEWEVGEIQVHENYDW